MELKAGTAGGGCLALDGGWIRSMELKELDDRRVAHAVNAGIRSMELKGTATASKATTRSPASFESVQWNWKISLSSFSTTVSSTRNPFNGIERTSLDNQMLEIGDTGIRSMELKDFVKLGKLVKVGVESVQWNWKY